MKSLALAASAAALLATGCAKPGSEATPVPSSFAECLQQQGIQLPTGRPSGVRPSGGAPRPSGQPGVRPSGGQGGVPGAGGIERPSNVDEATWQTAVEKCGSLRPSRGPNELSAFLNCLSERGITYSPGMPLPDSAKVCEVLRPSRSATP